MLLALALALPVLAGWAITGWLRPWPGSSAVERGGRLAASALAGIGLSSVTTFCWLLAGGSIGRLHAFADALLLGSIAVAGMVGRRARPGGTGAPPPSPRLDRAAAAAMAAALLVAIGCVSALGVATPHGEADGWMMWNLRARFLLRAGEAWPVAFAPELGWTSTEYPLLLPLAIARLWGYAGEAAPAPAALALVFAAAAPLALAASAGAAAGTWRGAAAGLLLLATPGYVTLAASQYADVPLAAFLVAGVGAAAGAGRRAGRGPPGSLLAAGLFLGLAGWTKNEGVAAAALVTVMHGIWAWRGGGPRAAFRNAALIATGALVPAAAWLVFHAIVTPRVSGVLFMGHTPGSVAASLADLHRWAVVARGLLGGLPGLRIGFPAAVVATAVVLAGRGRGGLEPRTLVLAGLLLALDAGVFMMTRWDLEWHLRLSADRLVLQAWPVLLLGLLSGSAAVRGGGSEGGATPAAGG
ncbi:MAG TPA: hypothetical protein VLS93_07225 [Anaeromyxobacteraceae bacterium]|nr:hypothetical protein [Anaeromyxobacteraceae bacterium]